MKYHIKLKDGSKLASFKNEYDRDLFLGVLYDEEPDLPDDYFEAVNEE